MIVVGGDHTHDSTIIYIPEEKVVFLGIVFIVDCYLKITFIPKINWMFYSTPF